VRLAGLRPHCEACSGVGGRETIEIEHRFGDETQWDWFHRRAPWGGTTNVLLGTLSHSGHLRGVLSDRTDQPHLVEAMDGVIRRLGGSTRIWRTDRLATVIVPGTRDVQASFAPVAKHYGTIVEPCPPRRGNRKGVVEAAVRYACGRWRAHDVGNDVRNGPAEPRPILLHRPRSRGRICSGTAGGSGWSHRCSPWATEPSASGPR
jgi:hypothetical protein